MPQHPPSQSARHGERSTQSVVCAAISALVRERWGRGPRRSRAYWAGPDALLVLLDDAYTDAERTLLEGGHRDEVLAGRRLLGDLAEPELHRIAADATGRAVSAVLSQSTLDGAVSTIVFLFARGGETREEDEPLGTNLQEALDRTESARALIAESVQASRRSVEGRARAKAARDERDRGERPQPPGG